MKLLNQADSRTPGQLDNRSGSHKKDSDSDTDSVHMQIPHRPDLREIKLLSGLLLGIVGRMENGNSFGN